MGFVLLGDDRRRVYQLELTCDGCELELAVDLTYVSVSNKNLSKWMFIGGATADLFTPEVSRREDIEVFATRLRPLIKSVLCQRCAKVMTDLLLEKGLTRAPEPLPAGPAKPKTKPDENTDDEHRTKSAVAGISVG